MMKVRITGMAFTPFGVFDVGNILTDEKYSPEFLDHLVNAAGAAEWIERETKVTEDYEPVKKPQSLPSSEPDKVSEPRTSGRRTKKHKLSL